MSDDVVFFKNNYLVIVVLGGFQIGPEGLN